MDSLKQQAYNLIKGKILSCEYAPNSYLSEKIIIDEIGMSRTPIRDALSRLEQEGLVVIHPKKGIWVSRLTFRDIDNVFEFRRLVELYAMRNHAYKINRATLQEIHDGNLQAMLTGVPNVSPNDPAKTYEEDDMFHDLLIRSTDNDYAIQSYASMRNEIHRLRILTGRFSGNGSRLAASRREHSAITAAMLEGDYEKAAQALSVHLTNSYNSSFSLLTRDYTIDISSLSSAQNVK